MQLSLRTLVSRAFNAATSGVRQFQREQERHWRASIPEPERPQRTIWVTSVRMRREDRTSISSYLLADLGR